MGFFSKKKKMSRGWALHIWSTVVVCTYCSSGFAVIWASSLEISLQDLWGRIGSKFCLLIFLSLVIQQLDWDICLVWIPLIGYGGSSGYSQVAGWTHYVGLFGIPLVGYGSVILAILIQYSKQADARTVV